MLEFFVMPCEGISAKIPEMNTIFIIEGLRTAKTVGETLQISPGKIRVVEDLLDV